MIERKYPLFLEVDRPSRSADKNVDAGGQLLALLVVVRAAKRQAEAIRKKLAELNGICTASSRVGARIKANGPDRFSAAGEVL